MQRRLNIQASTSIIFLSILTILVQFAAYYYFEANIVIWIIAGLISILCCQLLTEHTVTYIACFNYSLLTLFISLVILVITYFGNVTDFLPYTHTMLGIAFINWMIPAIYAFLRYMFDFGSKIEDFRSFYRNSSIVFLLIYIVILVFGSFAADAFPWAYDKSITAANFSPFEIISAKIEDYIYGSNPLSDILTYLASRSFIFIPYGFYISLVLHRQKLIIKLLALLALPFLIEMMQYFTISARCDIDDLFYALIGGVLGIFSFFLTNIIFRVFSGHDFYSGITNSRFSFNALHF